MQQQLINESKVTQLLVKNSILKPRKTKFYGNTSSLGEFLFNAKITEDVINKNSKYNFIDLNLKWL